ncbi:MAG: flagellar basal body rod C-terminal domain-containing protein [Candidatus Gastranaerophilales bacterium]|nr:flagellar basal body rod C-terminal domain-containing protein [Candidatus Gastranaerophilales bacterium]
MKIFGGLYYSEDGLSSSLRGMNLQAGVMNSIGNNINGFNKVGYQRKVPVVSSFSELIGIHALSEVADTKAGRISRSDKPLDFALVKEGYFQYQTPEGIKLTRDGRFKMDKAGNLLTLENQKVLSINGQPIKFKTIPESMDQIKVDKEGKMSVYNSKTNKLEYMNQLSVVSNKGKYLSDIYVRQGYVENSNVSLHSEFMSMLPVRRNFEANRQMYIIQNDELSRVIQELGRST